jgi:hypothetical protein
VAGASDAVAGASDAVAGGIPSEGDRRGRDAGARPGTVCRSKRHTSIRESKVRDRLADSIPGSLKEVRCSSGVVDVVTPHEIIEVKRAPLWKAALGQVLAYSQDFPKLRPRVHLFGADTYDHYAVAASVCRSFGVTLTADTGLPIPVPLSNLPHVPTSAWSEE